MEYVTALFNVALLASAIRVTMPILLTSLGPCTPNGAVS